MTRDESMMGFPTYAYLPGRRPHPTRDPEGHSHGKPHEIPARLAPATWEDCPDYLRGIALFNAGYYWEAHEAWEGLWIAAGREGPVGALLSGLIKLAAAALKVRQGRTGPATRLGRRAAADFGRSRALVEGPQLAGLWFAELLAFAEYIRVDGEGLVGSPDLDVEVVFSRRLTPRRNGPDG